MPDSYFLTCWPWAIRALVALLALAGTTLAAHAQVSFAPVVSYPVNGNAQGIVSADFNGDGRPDLATSNSGSNTTSVLLQSATTPGTFLTRVNYASGGDFSTQLAAGDVNGDGRPDLAVVNQTSGSVSILLNVAATPGTFAPAVVYPTSAYRGIALVDVDADNRLDLVLASMTGVSVLLNSATTPGTFGPATAYPVTGMPDELVTATTYSTGSSNYNSGVAIGDVTGDGLPDIISCNTSSAFNGTTISILPNSAATPGTFPTTPVGLASGGTAPIHALVRDLNADGRPDIAVSNLVSQTVGVLLSTIPLVAPTP